MRAVYLERFGGPDVLTFGDRPAPSPKPGEALVRVRACGINHLDLWVRSGLKGLEPEMPHILGNEVVGEIAELGAGITHLTVGAKTLVNPTLSCGHCAACANGDDNLCRSYDVLGRKRNGGYAEFVSVPAANCLPFPENLSWEQAAAVPLVFLTAWHMLVTRAHVRAGEDVLVIGAGSGVGSAAIQVARLHGARVIATAGSTPSSRVRWNWAHTRRSITPARTSPSAPGNSPARRAWRWWWSTWGDACSRPAWRPWRATGGWSRAVPPAPARRRST